MARGGPLPDRYGLNSESLPNDCRGGAGQPIDQRHTACVRRNCAGGQSVVPRPAGPFTHSRSMASSARKAQTVASEAAVISRWRTLSTRSASRPPRITVPRHSGWGWAAARVGGSVHHSTAIDHLGPGRQDGVHALIAVCVNADGDRETLEPDVTTAQGGAGSLTILRSPVDYDVAWSALGTFRLTSSRAVGLMPECARTAGPKTGRRAGLLSLASAQSQTAVSADPSWIPAAVSPHVPTEFLATKPADDSCRSRSESTLDEQLSMRWRSSRKRRAPGSSSQTTRSIHRWPSSSMAARTGWVGEFGFRRACRSRRSAARPTALTSK